MWLPTCNTFITKYYYNESYAKTRRSEHERKYTFGDDFVYSTRKRDNNVPLFLCTCNIRNNITKYIFEMLPKVFTCFHASTLFVSSNVPRYFWATTKRTRPHPDQIMQMFFLFLHRNMLKNEKVKGDRVLSAGKNNEIVSVCVYLRLYG